jgi:hypothetical protein
MGGKQVNLSRFFTVTAVFMLALAALLAHGLDQRYVVQWHG